LIRGVIEGFYGAPWSHEERLDLIAFCGGEGLDTWVHAPKDDRYHRAQWADPYPEPELERLGGLVAAARRHGVGFAYAIAPGLSICHAREEHFAQLLAKCEQVRAVGVSTVQLLWDDLEHALTCPEDSERYGGEESPVAAAQAEVSNRLARELDQPGPLVVCPTAYAGTEDSPYRRTFRRLLAAETAVYWTGPEVVSIAITREELDVAAGRFGGRQLVIWDNYPVNDFDPGRLFLGPLRARDPRLFEGPVSGLIANAMLQAVPSKLPLATVADFLRDPRGYDPISSFQRALGAYGAEVLDALRRLAPDGAANVRAPGDVASLVEALAPGVDAATGVALLEPFA
jgi:hyaluronoglucosaminidase